MAQRVWECLGRQLGLSKHHEAGAAQACSGQVLQMAVASCSWAVS